MWLRTVALSVFVVLASARANAFVWPTLVEQVDRELKSTDAALRRRGALKLTELPRALAVRLTLRALDDADPEVRLAAADAARELAAPGAGERVITWLNDPDRRIRSAAAAVLRESPTERAVPALGRSLADAESDVRAAAAEALGETRSSAAVVALLGHLDDGATQVRKTVVEALGSLRDARAVVPLIGKVQDREAVVRRAVARALGDLGNRQAASALVLALRDNDEGVRVAALEALGTLVEPSSASALVASLEQDTSSAVKSAAVTALGRFGSPETTQALIRTLASDDPELTEQARVALERMGPAVVPRLSACLEDKPPSSDGCALVLGALHTRAAAPAIIGALKRGLVTVPSGIAALGALGDPEHLPLVLERLTDPDAVVKSRAVAAAFALLDPARPDGRAVEPIVRALDNARQHRAEQLALIALLGRTGSPRAVTTLAPFAVGADDDELRTTAIEALGYLGPAGQEGVLLSALDDEDARVRLAAALALNRSASPGAARPLMERLERRAEQDRSALALALAGALARKSQPALVPAVVRLIARAAPAERDALIEALGRMPGQEAERALASSLERSPSSADRAKLAEALASHPGAARVLERLARDVDGAVRANAVWSLGNVGAASEQLVLEAALRDRDVGVSGNAAAALARLARRTRADVRAALCPLLDESRGYVRANALAALALVGRRCPSFPERRLLAGDPSDEVRRAAALLLERVPASGAGEEDRAALARCAARDPDGEVASQCLGGSVVSSAEPEPITVFVLPAGEGSPVPRAPFALRLANGLMRLGVSDRRGAVFEAAAPSGTVSLAVPAPLAEY